ncbi:MAG: GNAT family N-acetyltransferase [Sedimentitalea sp.]
MIPLVTIPTLETARLDLRGPAPTDLAAYRAFNAESDVKVGSYRGGHSAAEVAARLDRDIAHWAQRGFGMWLVRFKSQSAVLGGVGLSHPKDWPSHELTWWLMPTARGTGIATEASRRVIDWAFATLGWPSVETHMRDENAPARRLAQRLGGRVVRRDVFPDGVARDVFSLPQGASA